MAEKGRPTQAQRDFAEWLFRKHGARLRAIARRNSASAEDAEEAVQRTMLIAMRADPEMPGEPLAWATTVVKREAWALNRKHADRIQRPNPAADAAKDPLDDLEAKSARPDEAAERAERVRAFRKAFDSLKPQEREVLLLVGAGLTYKDIEERMGYTHTKINRCVAEGRANLRERMSAWEREGSAALDDLYNLRTLDREPTRVLLRRRGALNAARRADSARADTTERDELSLNRLRARYTAVKARRLALEAGSDAPRSVLVEAQARERDAREALNRLGARRGAQELAKSNRKSREQALIAIDAELARRRESILLHAVRQQPAYVLEAFGPRPEPEPERVAWCRAVDRLVALRQLHGITDSERALGEEPSDDVRKRLQSLRRSLAPQAREIPESARRSGPELAL